MIYKAMTTLVVATSVGACATLERPLIDAPQSDLNIVGAAGQSIDASFSPARTCNHIARLARDGQRNAFALDLAPASRSFQEAITLFDRLPEAYACDFDFSQNAARIHHALVLSNQRYFLLADGIFEPVAEALEKLQGEQADRDRALLFAYQALHELNRGAPTEAGIYSAESLDRFGNLVERVDTFNSGDELLKVDPDSQRTAMNQAQALYVLGSTELLAEGSDGECEDASLERARTAIPARTDIQEPGC